jgi:hypothetical protein
MAGLTQIGHFIYSTLCLNMISSQKTLDKKQIISELARSKLM